MQLKQILAMGLSLSCLLPVLLGIAPFGHAESATDGAVTLSVAASIVSNIHVKVRDSVDHETKWIEMARSIIFIREGDRFSPARLQESIEALRKSKRFEEIHVDSEDENGRITLLFDLTPFRLIKDIKIDGEYPLFEREILNAMTIYVGDALVHERLAKQEPLIAEAFQRQGFMAPKVAVTAFEDPKDGHFVIHVKIDKGPYYTLERLEIKGNRAFSDARLKSKMKTWRVSWLPKTSGRFIEKDLTEDIRNLTKFYWKKGYPDALTDFKIEKDSTPTNISVFVTIHEGAQYHVEFVGNDNFWDYTLKQDLILFEEGNKHRLGLKKSIKKIKERYRMAGYLATQVRIEEKIVTDKGQTKRMIRLVIDEGPCSIVDSIRITGNHAFDDEKIEKQMLTRLPGFLRKGAFVPETLEKDLYAIKALYLKQGYLDTQVNQGLQWSEYNRSVTVSIVIDEGVQTLVSSVKIVGITVLGDADARGAIRLKEGEPFRRYMIQSDENSLSALISKKGYPHIKVKGNVSISEDQSKAHVVYSIDEGPHVEMGQVYYTGNFRTKEKILQNELGIRPGEPFSLVRMLQGQSNIRNLDILRSVRFKAIGLKEKIKKIDLFVEVEEEKPYFVELGGGYDTERGFSVQTKGGDHNLFGTNKYAWMGGERSQIGHRGELGITEPRLFGSRILSTFGAFTERREEFNQDFGTRIHGSSLGFSRKWFRHLSTGLDFRFEKRDQFRRDSAVPERKTTRDDIDEFEPRSILVTTPSISYTTRDSFIRPKRGTFSSLSVDMSRGLTNSLDDFLKYRLDLRYYWSPILPLTFAWLGRAGYIDPYGPTRKVPDDQLFFLGGTSDVRGFKENMLRFDGNRTPLGGRTAIAGSMEARIDLGYDFELTGFYDVGSVRDTFNDAGSDEFRSSVGMGLRYITPIGPIGFLYGFKLDPKKGESSGRLHFAIGYTF
jgi:outer membrane protein insertion porin family